jgi:hypothetical protein
VTDGRATGGSTTTAEAASGGSITPRIDATELFAVERTEELPDESAAIEVVEKRALIETTEGMARKHIGSSDLTAFQQRVEVRRYLPGVLSGIGSLAPSSTGTVVNADLGVASNGRFYPSQC